MSETAIGSVVPAFSASNSGGSGDVVGPNSSTDNAIVRWDGATGKLVQNSTVTLSDGGALAGLTTIDPSTIQARVNQGLSIRSGAGTGSAGRNISIQPGDGSAGQDGGALNVLGGAGVTGGGLSLQGGAGTTLGGDVALVGGTGPTGGVARLRGGASSAGPGGDVELFGGTGTGGIGGRVILRGAQSTTGRGGVVELQPGNGPGGRGWIGYIPDEDGNNAVFRHFSGGEYIQFQVPGGLTTYSLTWPTAAPGVQSYLIVNTDGTMAYVPV